jgi:hypothetical protein
MDHGSTTMTAAAQAAAAAWPLAAGLALVLWSKLRALQPAAVCVRRR